MGEGSCLSVEIGKRLRQARETLGLTLADIEAQTRIHRKYLEAIENGQFDLLPGPIYVRSYIRSYANVVGENPQALLKLYQSPIGSQRMTQGRLESRRSVMSLPKGNGPSEKTDAYSSSVPLSRTSRYSAMNQKQIGSSDEYERMQYRNPGIPQSRKDTFTSQHLGQNPTRSHLSQRDLLNKQSVGDIESRSRNTERTSIRRPVMPSDVPPPEELGIKAEEQNSLTDNHSLLSGEQQTLSSQTKDKDEIPLSFPSRRQRKGTTEKKWSFGKIYTLILIVGAVLLVISTLLFMWYRIENAGSNQQQQVAVESSEAESQEEKPKGEPRLHVINTSPTGMDRYELVNAEELELKITWLNGGDSPFEIRDQEVGDPIDSGVLTNSNKEFIKKFNSSIWLKLFKPNQVNVQVNGQDIQTDIYENEKVIYISFLN